MARPTDSAEDGLLRAVAANPGDDTVRLVYCDWLEEEPTPDRTARAEFTRWQLNVPSPDLRPVVIKLEGGRRGDGTPYREPVKLADCLAYRPWLSGHRTLAKAMHERLNAPGRSVVVCNSGRSCGVVWRRGGIAACWASYVSYTKDVLQRLQRHPLEVFHYYGEIPGSSRVVDTVRSSSERLWRCTLEFRWHKFRCRVPFTSAANDVYTFGDRQFTGEFDRDRRKAIYLGFEQALQHHFPKLRAYSHRAPPARPDQHWRRYQLCFSPGAHFPETHATSELLHFLPVELPDEPAEAPDAPA